MTGKVITLRSQAVAGEERNLALVVNSGFPIVKYFKNL